MVDGRKKGIESLTGRLWRAGPRDLWSEQCLVNFYERLWSCIFTTSEWGHPGPCFSVEAEDRDIGSHKAKLKEQRATALSSSTDFGKCGRPLLWPLTV